jgi:hypothetical protein
MLLLVVITVINEGLGRISMSDKDTDISLRHHIESDYKLLSTEPRVPLPFREAAGG